jgi:copper transporter 1
MFAASCIGVIALVVVLEFLRRLGREYDRKLQQSVAQAPLRRTSDDSVTSDGHATEKNYVNMNKEDTSCSRILPMHSSSARVPRTALMGRQLIRSVLHVATFAVAYMVMLLAMYYNGMSLSCRGFDDTLMICSRIHNHQYLDWRFPRVLHLQLGSA